MIEVSHLTKKYGSRLAVDDISFTVEDGVIYGLLGPNGAGKSTIMNILTGYLAATEGQVTVAGHPFEFPVQGFALLALVPIWLYNGQRGFSHKAVQYGFYAFYPLHILILSLIALYLM